MQTKINPTIFEGGYVGIQMGKREMAQVNRNEYAVTHWLHKPYALDWSEAVEKAYERVNRFKKKEAFHANNIPM